MPLGCKSDAPQCSGNARREDEQGGETTSRRGEEDGAGGAGGGGESGGGGVHLPLWGMPALRAPPTVSLGTPNRAASNGHDTINRYPNTQIQSYIRYRDRGRSLWAIFDASIDTASHTRRLAFTRYYCCTLQLLCGSHLPPALPALLQYYSTSIAQDTTPPRPPLCMLYTIQYW